MKNDFFEFHHAAFYYPYLDLCYIADGLHTSTVGVFRRKGSVTATICKIEQLFAHVRTDGKGWYNSHTVEKIEAVFDFRIAVIYETARKKYELEQLLQGK